MPAPAIKGTLSAIHAQSPPPTMNTNHCHDPTRLSTSLESSIQQTRAPQGASCQCPAFFLTGVLRGVYRNVLWRSIQGLVQPSLAVPGLSLAASRLCDGLSTTYLGAEYMNNPQLQLQNESCFHPLDLLDSNPSVLLLKRPFKANPYVLGFAVGLLVEFVAKLAL